MASIGAGAFVLLRQKTKVMWEQISLGDARVNAPLEGKKEGAVRASVLIAVKYVASIERVNGRR